MKAILALTRLLDAFIKMKNSYQAFDDCTIKAVLLTCLMDDFTEGNMYTHPLIG